MLNPRQTAEAIRDGETVTGEETSALAASYLDVLNLIESVGTAHENLKAALDRLELYTYRAIWAARRKSENVG